MAYFDMAGCADDVAAWLEKLGLTEYTDKFLTAGYSSLPQCVLLSKADLTAIGIGKVGHVNRLIRDLERMKADGELEMSPSPPNSPSSSPVPPAVVKTVAPPSVPPRRTLPRKPNSDGNITDSPPPPKLLPRKGSLRKSTSVTVIQPSDRNKMMHEQAIPNRIPTSQSLNDICENQSPNESSATVPRVPPPIAPRKILLFDIII